MKNVELIEAGLDRLLHSPTGPVAKHLLVKGEEVRHAADEEAGIVIKRSGDGIMKPPELRFGENGDLEVSIETNPEHRTSRNLARKATKEGSNSWLGRGLFKAI